MNGRSSLLMSEVGVVFQVSNLLIRLARDRDRFVKKFALPYSMTSSPLTLGSMGLYYNQRFEATFP